MFSTTWKIPEGLKVFFVPMPQPKRNPRFESILNYKYDPEKPKERFTVIDPNTNEQTVCEILDYLIYPIDAISDVIAKQTANSPKVTGQVLAALLRKKRKEHTTNEKVIFYQLTPIAK